MTKQEYFIHALKTGLLKKFKWVVETMGIHQPGYVGEYISITDKGYVTTDDSDVMDKYDKTNPLYPTDYEVKTPKDAMACLTKDITSNIGKIIVNYLLIEVPFGGRLEYVSGELSSGSIIKKVGAALREGVITVQDYKRFVECCAYLEGFNILVAPSSTAKMMVPPPGLKAFKAKLKKEYTDKYGTAWAKDTTKIVEYDTKLKEYLAEYLKDDPSNGIMVSGKVKNNALPKTLLTFSADTSFGMTEHVDESLMDGYPKDPDKLVAIYNSIRSASISRGGETQKGGSVAKSVLRATSSSRILKGDCGVKYGKSISVTKANANEYIGRYFIVNGKPVLMTKDTVVDYVGKSAELRSPMYCINKTPTYCSICMGERAGNHEDGIALIVTNISAVLTKTALKAMHDTTIKTIVMDLNDVIF